MITEPDLRNLLKAYNTLLYFAGSMIMNEPTEECVVDFWKNGKLKRLPVSSSNPRFMKAAELLRDACQDKSKCQNSLTEDYFRLFSPSGLPLAPAFASAYSGKITTRSDPGEDVSRFYESYGWHYRSQNRIPDDHLGIELLFLTKLTDKYTQLEDEPCRAEMKKEIRRFISLHLLSWVPVWNEDIQEHAQTSVYRGIGTLVYASIEDLYGIFA